MADQVPQVCPYCRKKLDPRLPWEKLRHHLDGKCISKKTHVAQQEDRRRNPKLPGF